MSAVSLILQLLSLTSQFPEVGNTQQLSLNFLVNEPSVGISLEYSIGHLQFICIHMGVLFRFSFKTIFNCIYAYLLIN